MVTVDRRRFVAGLIGAGALFVRAPVSFAFVGARRIVALDWASAETMFAIGVPPIAISSPYRGGQEELFGAAALSDTLQLGSMFEPNFEVLQSTRPDLIFYAPWHAHLVPSLQRIAAVHLVNPRLPTDNMLRNASICTIDVGKELAASSETNTYVDRCDEELERLAERVRGLNARPALVGVLSPDGRHLSLYIKGSLLHDVLERLGLQNAYRGPASPSGNITFGIERLADFPDADLYYLDTGPQSDAALRILNDSTLWNALNRTRRGTIKAIPYVWPFGAMASAMAFARSVTAVMSTGGDVGNHG